MQINKQNIFLLYPSVVFLLMFTAMIYYKPSIFLCIPLLVSVVIMFLQSRVNRYAFLLGAINSILYAVAYMKMTLYSTAVYAILVSCPLQAITFFNWSNHTQKSTTELKRMSLVTRLKTVGIIIGGFLILYIVFSSMNSKYLFFDNCISILGIAASVLCMLRYQEYTFLQILGAFASLITFFIMVKSDPSKIIWIINSVHSLISTVWAFINMNKNIRQKS